MNSRGKVPKVNNWLKRRATRLLGERGYSEQAPSPTALTGAPRQGGDLQWV
jgi:hypothetical protein